MSAPNAGAASDDADGVVVVRERSRWRSTTRGRAPAWALLAVITVAACSKLPHEVAFDGPAPPPGVDGLLAARDGLRRDGRADGDWRRDGGTSLPAFDWRDGVMYFVLLDRFLDGDPANNKPESGVETPANWQGGDLAGLLQKLQAKYFSTLGVNVLWISSPVDAPAGKFAGRDGHDYTGFHGYWPRDLTKVEGRLGDLPLLKQVVSEAHRQGIRIIIDYVMNHVHDQSPTYKAHGDWFWPVQQFGKTCVCGAGCSYEPPEGLSCWFDPFLPDFDFGKVDPRKFSVDSAVQWARDTGIDGFRLDAVKHIEMAWLTDMRSRAKAELTPPGGRFYMVGETFDGSKTLIKSFVDPATKLDGQFDFPLRAQLVKNILLRQGSLDGELEPFLNANDSFYGATAVMGTFLGNHDLPRAIHLAEDSPQFGDWDSGKSRAWNNTPQLPGNDAPFERLGVAFTALLTLPGLPLIYYGDEIGMAGAGDPDNRRFMQWSGTTAAQDKLRAHITRLTAIRQAHPALRRGTRQQVWLAKDVYGYRMSEGGDQLIVVLNRSDQEQTIKLTGAASFKDLLSGDTVTASAIKLPPRSARVLQ